VRLLGTSGSRCVIGTSGVDFSLVRDEEPLIPSMGLESRFVLSLCIPRCWAVFLKISGECMSCISQYMRVHTSPCGGLLFKLESNVDYLLPLIVIAATITLAARN